MSHVITERKQVTPSGWMDFTLTMTVKIRDHISDIRNGTGN